MGRAGRTGPDPGGVWACMGLNLKISPAYRRDARSAAGRLATSFLPSLLVLLKHPLLLILCYS
jgi:hypothetical protein